MVTFTFAKLITVFGENTFSHSASGGPKFQANFVTPPGHIENDYLSENSGTIIYPLLWYYTINYRRSLRRFAFSSVINKRLNITKAANRHNTLLLFARARYLDAEYYEEIEFS